MQRVIEPELLDVLPADDPAALRSRRDLRVINALMGNERWILRCLLRFRSIAAQGITEWGAGQGQLSQLLSRRLRPRCHHAYDLLAAPHDLPPSIQWHSGDLFAATPPAKGGTLVANLFLHHFHAPQLTQLSRWCESRAMLCFCEPWRHALPLWLGRGMFPLCNSVTRHDMITSIRAGFVVGELPEMLHLSSQDWQIEENCDWRGSVRLLAWRK